MSKLRILFLAMALCAAQASAAAAQVLSVPPPPMMARGDPAPANAGQCMWAAIPQAMKDEALAQPTALEAATTLITTLAAGDRGGFEASARACGVGDNQFASAGRRLGGWAGRAWAEKRLEGRIPAERLDRSYLALSVAEKAVLSSASAKKGPFSDAERQAIRGYFTAVGLDLDRQDDLVAVLTYLISRLGDEADLANGR